MTLTLAVWLVILGALATANLPFLLERPLAPWPWGRAFQSLNGSLRWIAGLGFVGFLALWSWGTVQLAGGAFIGVGSALFVVKLLISIALAALLLYLPGVLAGKDAPSGKPFIDRLLEAMVGYLMIGTLGFTMELDMGNAFPQGWEFYAVTLALFVVLGYPGFVWRYMMQRRRR
ncbi:DUF2818 family protein [Castellaniella sp.]|uniref:DUF2818 family protein n=1 Tax=Castellaniella sp. TaxID=1955812 RepID=UPI002AFDD6C1|nr:DUF2818 family protein [Castellaniella sp.]